MSADGPKDGGEVALPAGWQRKPGPDPFAKPTFAHESGGWTVATLVLNVPGRFPPFYNFATKSWVSVAPTDDGSGKKALVLQTNGKLPTLVEKAIAAAEAKKKNAGPGPAIRLPVKLDKPIPKLPQGW
jgi:hypothetical protein